MSNVPENLHYSKDHEWIRVEGDTGTVGITDHAQDSLGDVVYVELPKAGESFEAHATFGSVESVKAVSELFIPVGGEVVEVNPAVAEDVQVLSQDPYTHGWLIKLRLDSSPASSELMDHDAYQRKVAEEGH